MLHIGCIRLHKKISSQNPTHCSFVKYIWVLLLSSCFPFCKLSLLRDRKRNRKNNWIRQEHNSFNRYFCACSSAARRCWAVMGSDSPTDSLLPRSHPNTSTSFPGLHEAFPCSFSHSWPHPFPWNNTTGCILTQKSVFSGSVYLEAPAFLWNLKQGLCWSCLPLHLFQLVL